MSIPQPLTPPIEDLRQFYVGKDISGVPKPAAILDVAIARRHCGSMLDAVRALGVGFRAHVKTHKVGFMILREPEENTALQPLHKSPAADATPQTTQLARLQAGESPSAPAHFIASTLAEIEHLTPTLSGYIAAGRPTTVLYGIPLPPSQAARLAALARQLGRASSVLVIVDHPSQLDALAHFSDIAGFPAGVYLKVDTGYHRAGVPASALNRGGMLERVVELERAGQAELVGLYSHSSLSYADSTAEAAMRSLAAEIEGCLEALKAHESVFAGRGDREITVSVGASPQVASIENFARREGALGSEVLRAALREVSTGLPGGLRTRLELHAGVYSVMDMQQLATNARTGLGGPEEEVALSVVAEVCSVYNGGEREKPEALVAVGTLGLGREPCPSYKGWGVVSRSAYASPAAEEPSRRLIVERISQEHAIVSWEDWAGEGGQESLLPIPLVIGQTVRIFPNHACVTGALYSWYLVVDSDDRLAGTKITDVWVRAYGW